MINGATTHCTVINYTGLEKLFEEIRKIFINSLKAHTTNVWFVLFFNVI